MRLRTFVTVFLAVCFLMGAQAQGLKQQGTSVGNVVPEDWSHNEVTGDLNKDGIADLVLMAGPQGSQPVLAVYFGAADGMMRQWRQYDHVLPADEDENCTHEVSLEITDRGVLVITINLSCSMGGWGTYIDRYFYRFQNGDFFLIGKENEDIQRNTGVATTVSENYLTWRRQVKTETVFEETPPKEGWSRLKRKPLEKLGERVLSDS